MSPRSNALLADLPDAELAILSRHLELVALHKGQTLFHAGETPCHVYFPVGAIVSMMNDSEDGISTETVMFGKACVVGVGALHQPSFYRASVRSSGLAYRMPTDTFLALRSLCPTYLDQAMAAVHRMIMQLSLSVVCAKRHPIDQQLIRWMLVTMDRSSSDLIPITHQELSEILGFRREWVTVTLKKMSARQDIALSRGSIEVLNRSALEERSCDCYWVGQQKSRPSWTAQAAH